MFYVHYTNLYDTWNNKTADLIRYIWHPLIGNSACTKINKTRKIILLTVDYLLIFREIFSYFFDCGVF